MLFKEIDLSSSLLLDCKPEQYINNPDNAVPIVPFSGSLEDLELFKVETYLSTLAHLASKSSCIKTLNGNHFKMSILLRSEDIKDAYSNVLESWRVK